MLLCCVKTLSGCFEKISFLALALRWNYSIVSDLNLQGPFLLQELWCKENDWQSKLSCSFHILIEILWKFSWKKMMKQFNSRIQIKGLVTWLPVINTRTFIGDRDNDIRIIGAGRLLWISLTAFCPSFLIENIDFHECFIDYTSKWLTCERIPFYSSPLNRFL